MPECREISHHFIAHTFSQSNNLYKQAYPTKPLTPLYALTQYEQLDITLYKKGNILCNEKQNSILTSATIFHAKRW